MNLLKYSFLKKRGKQASSGDTSQFLNKLVKEIAEVVLYTFS